jgi:hypothetical protein
MSPQERLHRCLEIAEERHLYILAKDPVSMFISDGHGSTHEVRYRGEHIVSCHNAAGAVCTSFAYNGMCSHAALALLNLRYEADLEYAIALGTRDVFETDLAADERWRSYVEQLALLPQIAFEATEERLAQPLLHRASARPFSLWRADE